jgi:hypothetical protein
VLTTCQPSTVWCSRERLPAAAAQPAKVRQSCSATDLFLLLLLTDYNFHDYTGKDILKYVKVDNTFEHIRCDVGNRWLKPLGANTSGLSNVCTALRPA